jgi:hypothetical protein
MTSLCQDKKFEFGIGIGNNGQLEKTLSDFYIWNHETYYLDDSNDDKTTHLKYSAVVRYLLNDKISIRLRGGYAVRKDYYINNAFPTEYSTYDYKQSVYNINPSICFSKQIDNFEIATGIEVPLMFVSPFVFKSTYKQMPDSVNVTQEINGTMKMDGGFVWGINNFISMRYYFGKRFSIGTEINYGLLFAKLGDKVESSVEYVIPAQPSPVDVPYEKKYKKTFFSQPEFSFGLSIKL